MLGKLKSNPANTIGEFPLIIRPAFTLGGSGGGIAYNKQEFEGICKSRLAASVTSQVLVEKSLLGWKEYELEVIRDLADNVVIICSIENIDLMGVHTGDSITVAPAQTLTDKEYQRLGDYSCTICCESCGSFAFEKFPGSQPVLTTQMKSVGESMAVGYTFQESFPRQSDHSSVASLVGVVHQSRNWTGIGTSAIFLQ
ncbi:ATP-grasp fold, subdomain 1 [Cynara cardunculus var. scolymus]|uniref:ATP-grasp fold, subdomain 1 n=1 Tax=Cynara cardunculus var. scolymus TaxID=59895 RepID=A0A103Y8P3_CYNCS|nr:ATP-grasp fold, subdomain 1 [Cynara cardunculus var. scolymus]